MWQRAHERLGGLDGVARAKAELVDALPADGSAVLNADDPRVAAMAARARGRVLTFGRSPSADVAVADLSLSGDEARAAFTVVTPWGRAPVRLTVPGAHMAVNAAAALAVALVCEVPLTPAGGDLGAVALAHGAAAHCRCAGPQRRYSTPPMQGRRWNVGRSGTAGAVVMSCRADVPARAPGDRRG
jgi:UDP-N-acetylmuramyl pentapeptide synthase